MTKKSLSLWNCFLIILICSIIFSFIFEIILLTNSYGFIKAVEYTLNLFFGLENPFNFIQENFLITIFSYILLLINWIGLPIIIIELFYRLRIRKKEDFKKIKNIFKKYEKLKIKNEKGENYKLAPTDLIRIDKIAEKRAKLYFKRF